MRLGAPVTGWRDAEEWAGMHAEKGYGAAYCPVAADADETAIRSFSEAARRHDLVIAEVGIWNNLLASDPDEKEGNIRRSIEKLRLADKIGARCAVNISGSRSPRWDGPHPDNLTEKTFDEVVSITRRILDEAKPERAFYTLEPMPWMYPTGADDMERLLAAVDRPQFAVHADMCNLVNSIYRVYHTGEMTRDLFGRLGDKIKSVHLKDTLLLTDKLTFCVVEALPGEGIFDYDTLLAQCAALPEDTPVMLEHLPKAEDYDKAAAFVKSKAKALDLRLKTAI